MTILITGIYGFLGSRLAEMLADKYRVIGLYHENTKPLERIIIAYKDMEQIDILPDVIVLCHAAVSSGNYHENDEVLNKINVDYTKKIINKFPSSKLIYISSVSVYSNDGKIVTERSADNPQTPYTQSKLAAEKLVMRNPGNYVIRLSSLYGKGMKENTLIPNYINQALQSKTISVWGNGGRYQNYIYIEDAINLIEKAIVCKSIIDFPLLGVANKEYTNAEVAETVSKFTSAEIVYIGEDNSLSSHYNNELTRKALDWSAATTLADGLTEYLEWKEKQY
jgi:UDP-glucose 4-epimerase